MILPFLYYAITYKSKSIQVVRRQILRDDLIDQVLGLFSNGYESESSRQQEIICYEHINSNAKPFFMLNSFCIEREREREREKKKKKE
jgi:hypothetical protein